MSRCPLLLTFILIYIVIDTKAQRQDYPRKTTSYQEYKSYFLWRQCRKIDDSHKGVTWDKCRDLCDQFSNCTAFNWAFQTGCETMDCGDFPPYPIGISKGKNGWWKGFTKYELEFGGRYYGPLARTWTNAQCSVISVVKWKDRVQCERLCDLNYDCSGFNFKAVSTKACVLRNCATTPPVAPYARLADWESYSKVPITKQHDQPWKCPSFHCGIEIVSFTSPTRRPTIPTELPGFWKKDKWIPPDHHKHVPGIVKSKCLGEIYAGRHDELCVESEARRIMHSLPIIKLCDEDRHYYEKLKRDQQERTRASRLHRPCCAHIRGIRCEHEDWELYLVYEYFLVYGYIILPPPTTTPTTTPRIKCLGEIYAGRHDELCEESEARRIMHSHPISELCDEDREYYERLNVDLQEQSRARRLHRPCCANIRGIRCEHADWKLYLVYEYFFTHGYIIATTTPRIKVLCFAEQFEGVHAEQCKGTSLVQEFIKTISITNLCEEDKNYLGNLSADPAKQNRAVQDLQRRCCAHLEDTINCLPLEWGHFLLLKYAIENHIQLQSPRKCFAELFAGNHENMCQGAIADQVLTEIPETNLCEEDGNYLNTLKTNVEEYDDAKLLERPCCASSSAGPINCSNQQWGKFLVWLYSLGRFPRPGTPVLEPDSDETLAEIKCFSDLFVGRQDEMCGNEKYYIEPIQEDQLCPSDMNVLEQMKNELSVQQRTAKLEMTCCGKAGCKSHDWGRYLTYKYFEVKFLNPDKPVATIKCFGELYAGRYDDLCDETKARRIMRNIPIIRLCPYDSSVLDQMSKKQWLRKWAAKLVLTCCGNPPGCKSKDWGRYLTYKYLELKFPDKVS